MSSSQLSGRSRPTALDVARRAGVSRTTVSFVLNGRSERRGITSATAERVARAASELGYVPDRSARLLRAGLSDLVVFAAPGPSPLSTLAVHVVTRLADRLAEEGLHLVTRRIPAGGTFQDAWRAMSPAVVTGMSISDADLEALRVAGVPAVSLDVAVFDEGLGAAQARHLLDLGHARLAFVAPAEPELAGFAERRLAAVRQVCEAAGAPAPVVVTCLLEVGSATAAVRAIRAHPGVTAVCAYNDERAFAVLAGMAELGLSAPADHAVVGADNDPLSAVAVPALTTVDPGVGQVADLLADAVLTAVRQQRPEVQVRVGAPRVLRRQTT